MRIESVALQGNEAWADLQWGDVSAGLNVVQGGTPPAKTRLVEFLAHVLYGQPPTAFSLTHRGRFPAGEVFVRGGNRRFRLRGYHDASSAPRLTVAGLDGSPVDSGTIHEMVGRLSPVVLAPLCAVSFRESPNLGRLLNPVFAREFQSLGGARAAHGSRRVAELAARRDLLAQELETRIAGERRVSKELDARWRELDHRVREEQQQAATRDQRLRAVETALAETDARLRYRRLELNVELRWHAEEPEDCGPQLAQLDERIAGARATLAELGQQEAVVRGRLAEIQASRGAMAATVVDQRAWLSVARQLAADLAGEVARLARASASEQCVCRDAHPRLRPIAETIDRQLEVLESLVDEQQRALKAAELQTEVDTLSRSQSELRRYLEHLLERRQELARGVRPSRRAAAQEMSSAAETHRESDGEHATLFSAADAAQLEERRLELEPERFELVEQLRTHQRALRDLRAQRDTVERQRAALLSARSIEHVQRELADVQRKLEQAAGRLPQDDDCDFPAEIVDRASDFLAQLTDGGLVRLVVVEHGCRALVVNRAGETLCVETIPASQRDLVYLSLCLGLLSLAAERGVRLPLLLDDPTARLDARSTAALAAVLDDFCRRGHQVLLFTSQPAAVERLASIGVAVRDMESLRASLDDAHPARDESPTHGGVVQENNSAKKRRQQRVASRTKRKKPPSRKTLNGEAPNADRSDAA